MAEQYPLDVKVTGGAQVEKAAKSVEKIEDGLDNVAKTSRKATKSLIKFNQALDEGNDPAWQLADRYGDLDSISVALGGPMGRLAGRAFELREAFGKLSLMTSRNFAVFAGLVAGAGALVVAFAAVAAAVVAATAAMAAYAIKASDAVLKTAVLREGLTGSAGAAKALTSTIRSVSSEVPLARSEVAKLAEDLYKSGKRGAELEESLRAASYEAAGLGKNPGPELIARRMRNLDTIAAKMKDSVVDIFSGPSTVDATDKFAKSLKGFTDLFGQNHSEGRALRKLLSMIVDPLIEGFAAAEPIARAFFRGAITMALDLAILAVRLRNAVLEMLPPEVAEAFSGLTERGWVLQAAFEAGRYVMLLFAGTVAMIAAVLGVVVGAIVAVAYAVNWMITAFSNGVVAGVRFAATVAAALFDLGSAGVEVAANLVQGLVGGINAGVGAVVSAITNLASSAISAAKAVLQIASPSKVFEGFGEYTGEGYVVGVEEQIEPAHKALETLVAPPALETPPTSGSATTSQVSGSDSSGASIDLSGATFNFFGVENAESSGRSMIEDAFTSILEGEAIAAGAQ